MDTRYGRVEWGPHGTRARTKTWGQPIRWNREAGAAGEIRKVFCASLADVFEDFRDDELAPWRRDLFALIDKTPNLAWLLLTKRPENIRRMWPDAMLRENVWLGTSIANQKNANEYVEPLTNCRDLCAYLFLSVEPQIGPVDLAGLPKVDWVICGGESRQGCEPRPFHVEWARDLRDWCAAENVAFFLKQYGSLAFEHRKRLHLRDTHGGDWNEWPEEMRVRECPEAFYAVA